MTARESAPTPWRDLPWLARGNFLALTVFALLLSLLLMPGWLHNPDLSHGILMPFAFVWLIYESRSEGPFCYLEGAAAIRASALLGAFGAICLAFAGLYAAVLGWSHSLVQFGLASAFALLAGAGLAAFADRRVRFLPLNWPACVAVGLWVLSAPIPTGTYSKLTLGLQLWVTTSVLHTLHFLGIAAMREGNIIALATARVGVEEACSGVRSLISCIFAGIFFSATLVKRPKARAIVIFLAAPLALAMNFFRSLTLTLLANAGINIAGLWHDSTGVAVLVLTALALAGIALALGKRPAKETEQSSPEEPKPPERPAATPSQRVALVGISIAAVLLVFFAANTHPSPSGHGTVPDLWAFMPDGQSASGWRVETTRDLGQFSGILETDHLAERIYTRGEGSDETRITLYLAYWLPGQASVSQVALHTPDACWPGAGWVQAPPSAVSSDVRINGHTLAGAEGRLFTFSNQPQFVWFWHLYDGRPVAFQNPYSITTLLKIAWHYGFKHEGDQLFVRVNSNRPWADIANQQIVRDFFTKLEPLGLDDSVDKTLSFRGK